MDRDEISGISREFEEVLEQVSAGIQPAEQVTGQPVPDEKLSGQQSFEKNAAARAVPGTECLQARAAGNSRRPDSLFPAG